MTDSGWMTAVTVGRWTNLVLAAVAIPLLFAAVRGWRYRSAGNRFLWLGIAALLANTVFGSAEEIYLATDVGWRTAATTVALVWVIVGLITKWRGGWYPEEYPHGHRRLEEK